MSASEAEKVIGDLQVTFQKHWHSNDLESLISLYHPDAVLVGKGQYAVYGKTDILAKFKELFKDGTPAFKLHQDTTVATSDGSYVIQKGRLEFAEAAGQFSAYEQIFKRHSDGSYLIYHDEFEP